MRIKKIIQLAILLLIVMFAVAYDDTKGFSDIKIEKGKNGIELITTIVETKYEEKSGIYITCEKIRYNIANYDFYLITNDIKEESYYIADTLKNNQKDGIVSLTIVKGNSYINSTFLDLEKRYEYIVNIQIYKYEENRFYNLNSFANKIDLEVIFANSKELKLGNDEISERLKITQSFYAYFQDLKVKNNEIENKSFTNLNQEEYIPNTSYDFYTNEDGIIFEYIDSFFGNFHTPEGYITDDPIVQIVPKTIFFELGRYLHIGKEYGFFVEVSTDNINDKDYKVEVLVFDILFEENEFPTGQGKLKIMPIFQKIYRAVDKSRHNNMWDGYDPSKNQVVYPHINHNYADLYIHDISVKNTIENSISSNIGDEGYVNLNDNGNYFQQIRLNYSGVGLKKNNGQFIRDTMDFAFGFFIPGYIEYGVDIAEGLISGGYSNYREKYASNNEENIQTYYPNWDDQCTYYGNLIKTVNISLKEESSKKVLYTVGSGYFETVTNVNRKGASINETKTTFSINMCICRDYSHTFLGIGFGDIANLVCGERTISNSSKQEINVGETIDGRIYSHDYHNIYKFIPNKTASYSIKTAVSSNLQMTLFNSNEEIIETDFNSGENGTALITNSFEKGEKYYIKIEGDNYIGDYSINVFYNTGNLTNLDYEEAASCSISGIDNVNVFEFEPLVTKKYSIETFNYLNNHYINDPSLELYNEEGNILSSNDNGGLGNNARIDCTMQSGQKYYIVVMNNKNSPVEHSIIVSRDLVGVNTYYDTGVYNMLTGIEYGENIFRYVPKSNDIYKFELDINCSSPLYQENTFSVCDIGRNPISKIPNTGYYNQAYNIQNSNNLIVQLEKNKMYYVLINCDLNNLYGLNITISKLEKTILNGDDEYNIINSNMTVGDNIKAIEIPRHGEYNVSFDYSGSQSNSIMFIVFQKTANGNYIIEDIAMINSSNNHYGGVINIEEENTLYLGYMNSEGVGVYNLTIERNVNFEIDIVLDPFWALQVGTEVTINSGTRNSTIFTKGFTRFAYIENQPAQASRLFYRWYSIDESIAIVSPYGTITAVGTGNTFIRVVNINDYSMVGDILITVIDNQINFKNITLTTDARFNDAHNGSMYSINEDNNVIYVGYTRSICVVYHDVETGNMAPTNLVQLYNWTSSNYAVASINSYGTITGISSGTAIITGIYKYNNFEGVLEMEVLVP